MSFFQVLRLAGPAERRMLQLAIAFKMIESLLMGVPLGLACLVCAALLGDPRAEALLPFEGFDSRRFVTIIGLMVMAYLGQFVFFYLASVNGFSAGYRLGAALRVRIADHLRRLPMGFFDAKAPGELAQTLMQDVMAIEMIPGTVLPRLVSILSLFALGLVAAFIADWRMGAALALGLPFALPALVFGYRTLRWRMRAQAEAMLKMNARLIEFICGIGVIRAFSLVLDRKGQVTRAIERYRDGAKALVSAFVMPTILYPLGLGIGTASLLTYGGWRLAEGDLSLVGFLFFSLLGLRLYSAIGELLDFSALTLQMDNALTRITGILDQPAPAPRPAIGLASPPEIVFDHVAFSYDPGENGKGGIDDGAPLDTSQRLALADLSFTVPARSCTALVGRSGAGKTTILKLLQRHWPPDQGRILIGGRDLCAWPEDDLRAMISVVSQRVALFSETVRDNIRLGRPDATDAEVEAAARAARCHDLIEALPEGYDTILVNGGALLSGGERQRLAIARAFLQDSRIIILDEATSALDVDNERLVQAALADLLQDRTVVVIAHRLWTVREADQILVLDQGKLVEVGAHEVLLGHERGVYRRLWQDLTTAPGWRAHG